MGSSWRSAPNASGSSLTFAMTAGRDGLYLEPAKVNGWYVTPTVPERRRSEVICHFLCMPLRTRRPWGVRNLLSYERHASKPFKILKIHINLPPQRPVASNNDTTFITLN